MSTDFQRVEAAFLTALESAASQPREVILDAVCGDDAELRRQVESLLDHHAAAADFLDSVAVEWLARDVAEPTTAGKATKWLGELPHVDTPLATTEWRPQGSVDPLRLERLMAPSSAWELPQLPPPAHHTDALGRLGEYDILEIVGRGGMGIVVKAWDQRLERFVALKIMKPFLAADPAARQRFLHEAQAAARVIHPHVVTIHAVHDTVEVSYLVMEYIEGRTLHQRIDHRPLDVSEIVHISRQAALGLAAAHRRGLVHRDVKPANILLVDDDERHPGDGGVHVKITDFGLARVTAGSGLTQSGMIVGTPQYMSPEQALGEPVDHRSDLFSLGSAMYAMCTGQAAFQADSIVGIMRKVSDLPHVPIQEINPAIPDWMAAIVDKLMAKRPEDRFQSSAEVAELLGSAIGSG